MISKKDLQEKLIELAKKGTASGNLGTSLGDYLSFVRDNYNDLDQEAKIVADKAIEIAIEGAREVIGAMPDGIQKRQLTRLHAQASGKHWDIKEITTALEKPTHLSEPILSATREFFLGNGQKFADLIFDVLGNSLKGPDTAILALYCSAIDEMTVAFHLAQHSYGPQVLSHVRTVYEIKDKIELFSSKPEHLQLWASDDPKDQKKIREEYSPSAVRKKIGKESYDPVYSFLSEMGTHTTMKYIQSKVMLRKPEDPTSLKREARIWVGGSPREDHLVTANTAVVQSLMVMMASFVDVYGQYLLAEEGIQIMSEAFEQYRAYMIEYFCNWMEKNGTDASKAKAFINSIKI